MSVTRHHAEWLSLVEVSGPFVSMPVLMKVFPQGLEPRDPAQARALRGAYEEWQDSPAAPGRQHAWVMHVLTAVLAYPKDQIAESQIMPAGLEASMPEVGETLRPDMALVGPVGAATAGQTQLLIATYPAGQDLDKPVIGKHWKASPATRMMELLHGANVPLGLVTNGEHWMLVYAPRGETTGYASWYGALWLDEPITLRAFHSLLGVRRFFGVAADGTLPALLKESFGDQQEVTDQLGYQVREAVEVLVQSFDALDKECNRERLKDIQPATVYDAALTIMMRLVFLFSAEERGLLHLGKPLYDDNYAISTLQEQLQEVADRHGEEVLERRYDAWARLLATFRAVHGGIQHQDLLMQAYGGSLFDPDRYPFLEGRAVGSRWHRASAEPLAVNNRVVLHLLNSLQRLRTRVGTGGMAETRRVSFRALGVEQIGHVYEGLLDHTAFKAGTVMLGIRGTRKKEPEIALSTLEDLLRQGDDKLLDFLKEETGRSVTALRKELKIGGLLDEHSLRVACDHEEALLTRLRPFTGLIRDDSFGRPWVVLPGSIFVTAGIARRSTGTHYTPPSLTEPIVQRTLEPLVYVGPAEGLPAEQWKLKSPKEILDLKVCDMAMGSGAFLVQACRYLAERLVEAWENEERYHLGQILVTPDGTFSDGTPSERLVPAEAAERIAIARRAVADRCLYGVDINPMAVEMAKLSMWLITVDASRPFTFIDHAFKCGDSLIGITSLDQLENFSLRPGGGKQQAFAMLDLWRHIGEAKRKRELLEAMPSDTPEQILAKAALCDDAQAVVAKLSAAADVLVALELKGLKGKAYETERDIIAEQMMECWQKGLSDLQAFAHRSVSGKSGMHWAIAFPEISGGGFHAVIGNPPFLNGKRISSIEGTGYQKFLSDVLARGVKGSADLSTFFMLRACEVANSRQGQIGLIVAKAATEGVALPVGLYQVTKTHDIRRARRRLVWPGTAGTYVSILHFTPAPWSGKKFLDDCQVVAISGDLEPEDSHIPIHRLSKNAEMCAVGSYILGSGFILTEAEARELLSANESLKSVLFPYLGGEDVNSNVGSLASRWIINFGDMAENQAKECAECYAILVDRVKPYRMTKALEYRRRWWQYARPGSLYRGLSKKLANVFVGSTHTKFPVVELVSTCQVFDIGTMVHPTDRFSFFSVRESAFHEAWAYRYGSTLGETLRYMPKQCFETYPFPSNSFERMDSELEKVGNSYHQARTSTAFGLRLGLTALYNQLHNMNNMSSEIVLLREKRYAMDQEVAKAYGWGDIELEYGFHETKQGIRFTISNAARRDVLDRLLALNHQRYVEEVAAAQLGATPAKRGRKKKVDGGQSLLDI